MAKYNDIKDELLQRIRDGSTFKEACKACNVSESQFYDQKSKKSDFSDEVKKAQADARAKIVPELEKSLYKKAMGWEYTETRTEYAADAEGNPIIVKQTEVTRVVPADTAALIFALTNLAPESWTNKQRQELTGDLKTTVKVEVEDKDTQKEIDKLGK